MIAWLISIVKYGLVGTLLGSVGQKSVDEPTL